ncbi:MAG TPA: M20 family metallopeptidase [Myxococcota bacterium]|nr:M20 family metallopeptidase [Myxococcota bacterium]
MSFESAKLLDAARAELPRAVALRRRIHQKPELGLDLPETTAALLDSLADLDLELARSSATSGVVARLRGGRPGPVVLLRADMDALPMPEDTGLPFASQVPGRMHACGHDAHTAMLAGAARVLARHRDDLGGDVLFFFQPGEEGFAGARIMLGESLFDLSEVTRAFALHIDPRVPVGRLASRSGALLASADSFSISVTGRGGHASMPHDALDPIPVACEIVQAIQSFVTRRIDAFDPAVISVTKIAAGTTGNVIPESADMLGTIRTTSQKARERAHAGLQRVVAGVCAAHGAEGKVAIVDGYPVTVNDAAQSEFARGVVADLLGDDAYLALPAPLMGAEDFSFVLEKIPGAMLFLGVRPDDPSLRAPCHSNRMVLNEAGMTQGIAVHAALALRALAT